MSEWHTRAKAEGWPDSATIAQALGPDSVDLAAQRAAGQLLGVWFKHERCFRYPPWQFLDGQIHPHLSELLESLAGNPAMTPAADPGGWIRLVWLDSPRLSLSDLALAEGAASDGVAADEGTLSDEGRTPAEVFVFDALAVVALARADAIWVSTGA
ncbi:hypothetical protein [Dyella solisilvae]|uniref:hypothetical protein n=1 Tax=Dyella solisilvae TaxID=1920168 RepID=UPI0011C03952|nr:hypothetical protein [Dyella solisilvae]